MPVLEHGSHVSGFHDGYQTIYATNYTYRDERVGASGKWGIQYPPGPTASVWSDTYLAPVQAPWNAYQKAIRAIVHAGDDWNGLGYPRSELSTAVAGGIDYLQAGIRYRISFGFYWPSSSAAYLNNQSNTEMLALFQFHQLAGNEVPQLAFYAAQGWIHLRVQGTIYPLYPVGTIPIERLAAVDIEIVPTSGENGVLKVWLDGVLTVDHVGPTATVDTGDAGYIKQGLYDYWSTVPDSLTLYLDDFTLSEET